ncbi:MauE/DoxX family redox-associated membrane protein [Streptosporangium sp. NPDC087985]|uniref:MauE/DoxX family redox-associated membrane protein n=1 Tax=Streptosporangium sp. NPDC087985 TaxID=3366196 RepID=UPI00381C3236
MNHNLADVLGGAAQIALIAIFMVAALSKILTFRDLGRTIGRLGLTAVAGNAAIAVIMAELLAVTGLAVLPAATWPRVLITLLAAAFAGAGIRALGIKEKIKCGCFGNGGAVLGWRQVLYLPLWLALAALAEAGAPGWNGEQGLAGLSALLLALVAWKLFAELRVWRPLREDRMVIPEPTKPNPEVPAT